MRRATQHIAAGDWPEAQAIATVTLDFDDRHRRRIRLADDSGEDFLLDLAEAARLEDGDGLSLAEGGFIGVKAAAEAVLDIHCRDTVQTARIAWHIGNRHVPIQLLDDGGLRIRDDHVLAAMLEGLSATVTARQAPFSPEPGAYADSHGTNWGANGGGHDHQH